MNEKKIKVLVITLHSGTSYGGFLQAYALCKTLNMMGYNARVINYQPAWRRKLGFRLLFPTKLFKHIYETFLFRKARAQYLLETDVTYRHPYELFNKPPAADVYVSGSDQIWNIMHLGVFDSNYFLSFVPSNKKRIAYAASSGGFDFEEYQDEVRKCLNDFDCISVRENSTYVNVKKLTSKTVEIVLDPTLLFDNYRSLISNNRVPKKSYILAYCFENKDFIQKSFDEASAALGLPVYYIGGYRFKRTTKVSFPTPEEWLGLIANADLVITNSFHGMAFSILFKRQFVVIPLSRHVKIDRMLTLCQQLGIENRVLTQPFVVNGIINELVQSKINYEDVDLRLSKARANSLAFLKESIEG